ncbi:hypothetical protein ACVWXL_006014 [Bradyrhizobium sp. GM22.5]
MSLSFANSITVQGRARALVPLCVGAGAYLFFAYVGDTLLQDSDSLWQIKIGQWILDHQALPYTDFYSFTRPGAPWVSTSWLSQVLFALSYAQWDWAGPVVLTALAVALSAAMLVGLLEAHLEIPRAVLFAMFALLLSLHHVLARPHMLALPVMIAWVGVLMAAADRKGAPSWYWLPLMSLWSNLHGGFVLGLALIGPMSFVALWGMESGKQVRLLSRWFLFGVAALAASCVTPYGWRTLLGAINILNLGELLTIILRVGARELRLLQRIRRRAVRPDCDRAVSRPDALAPAYSSDPASDLDGAHPRQEHRGLRLPGAAGAGQAPRRTVCAAAAWHAGRRELGCPLRHRDRRADDRGRRLDLDLTLHGASPLHLHDGSDTGRRRRSARETQGATHLQRLPVRRLSDLA